MLVQLLWITVGRFLKKLNIELPYDLAIPLLGIYPEKTIIRKDTCTPRFICSIIHNSQEVEATSMSIDREMDTEDVVHTHNGKRLRSSCHGSVDNESD